MCFGFLVQAPGMCFTPIGVGGGELACQADALRQSGSSLLHYNPLHNTTLDNAIKRPLRVIPKLNVCPLLQKVNLIVIVCQHL
jgi:hypothetical protein